MNLYISFPDWHGLLLRLRLLDAYWSFSLSESFLDCIARCRSSIRHTSNHRRLPERTFWLDTRLLCVADDLTVDSSFLFEAKLRANLSKALKSLF